ncbi:HNH endonuclease [Guptibacillus hwajinpoensis]|uniref:HNH endonuclease n=1 Tax=Guptibacillus hwajinpoensis TaxID=208199 RepID=UPI003736E0C0
MSLPKNISKQHVLLAIQYIDEKGVPKKRLSTRFHLIYNGKLYPPKYVLSIANTYANGEELPPSFFSGGMETNSMLSELGFEIKPTSKATENIVSSFSWTVLSETTAIKKMDRSTFLHNGTGIPREIRPFFEIAEMEKGEKRKVTLVYKGSYYECRLVMDKMDNQRSRLLWSNGFTQTIQNEFPNEYNAYKDNSNNQDSLVMTFNKRNSGLYDVTIEHEGFVEDQSDFNVEQFEDSLLKREYAKGKETKYYLLTVKIQQRVIESKSIIHYRVMVKENHQTVKESVVTDRGKINLLTDAKKKAMKLLLEHNPIVSIDDITMVHYKQDRPNSDVWQKDSYSVLENVYHESRELNAHIDIERVEQDLEAEKAEEEEFYQEGAVSYYYGKRYERNPLNRQRAIEIHGLTCAACDFNFEKKYGEHGKDFIEVHHIKPLSTLSEEVEINPAEDLVPVCSNCHRMIHRQRDNVLSIDELRNILMK